MRKQLDDSLAEMNKYCWWHSIDLGNGLVTPGAKSLDLMAEEYRNSFDGLSLHGRSVLDIGAWNGGFSIEAKRRGARRVLALDRPGQANMQNARDSLNFAISKSGLEIETIERDVEVIGALDGIGQFDVVLFLGVFYHLIDPVYVLRQLYPITKEVLVLETHVVVSSDSSPLMIFYPTDELNHDASNWWGPNIACVEYLLKTIGFSRVEIIQPKDKNRAVFRAFR
ncbi:MAG: DUF1698 domain-containing protein [Syntrophobacteraceae bacterium]|nr:DUF1698 domain-containing protein [Desulfobacteraceae bacterium]